MTIYQYFFNDILSTKGLPKLEPILGQSRQSRPIHGSQFGAGPKKISLLAGCHADEPVGPLFLSHFAAYLQTLDPGHPLVTKYTWWIVPHVNPDGKERNKQWSQTTGPQYDLVKYLKHAVREYPGQDVEFGFPRDSGDDSARPENKAVYRWWHSDPQPFSLHVSLHGLGFAAGPWHLIEAAWKDRCELLKVRCRENWERLKYEPHDIDRKGEKGFFRLGRGFCTRPDSKAMQAYFLEKGDKKTAALFRPSSMETIRSLGGDPLTLVSEMPLFILPSAGKNATNPHPPEIIQWRLFVNQPDGPQAVLKSAEQCGLRPMPIKDQMELQWGFICAGLEQIE